jgi:alkanesulfonate monooxygenase SsuD/methylene tetrahydromethanopterin reductase-like flavin-dependent oxidoreductase (luciferase family)
VYEPLVTLAYLAAETSRIRLGTSVLVLPMRNPYAVAKQAATLHRLSGDRVILGIGAGWDAAEFAAVGAEFHDRGRRTDEGLAVLRALIAGEHPGGVFEPRLRAPLPIMIGGTSDRALRRAALLGDEWQGVGLDASGFAKAISRLRELSDRPVRVGTRLEGSEQRLARFRSTGEIRAEVAGGIWASSGVGEDPEVSGEGCRSSAVVTRLVVDAVGAGRVDSPLEPVWAGPFLGAAG